MRHVWLDLTNTAVTASGLSDALKAKELRYLLLNGCKNITDQELGKLKFNSLSELSLIGTKTSVAGLEILLANNPTLTQLFIGPDTLKANERQQLEQHSGVHFSVR
jgi:hypothetical protein